MIRAKWSVWWRNPDKHGVWDLYQAGLSRAGADRLAFKVTYVMSPRWGHGNVPTQVLPDGAMPRSVEAALS